METVAIFGAAGSMGTRVTDRLIDDPDYELLLVEKGEGPKETLRDRGHEPTPRSEAIDRADIVILAVPDTLIGRVSADVVPDLNSGTLVVCLDPAAPHAGELPERDDVTYFVTHPGHLPVFNDETDPEAKTDYFGSGKARQPIVNALMQGPEADYERGEQLARKMWGPVLRSHRVTVEQMAMLEPILSENVALTCVSILREALDETIDRGVPEEAARDFLLGHVHIELAILFDELDWSVSEGAARIRERGMDQLIKSDWKKVFEPEEVKASARFIVEGGSD